MKVAIVLVVLAVFASSAEAGWGSRFFHKATHAIGSAAKGAVSWAAKNCGVSAGGVSCAGRRSAEEEEHLNKGCEELDFPAGPITEDMVMHAFHQADKEGDDDGVLDKDESDLFQSSLGLIHHCMHTRAMEEDFELPYELEFQ